LSRLFAKAFFRLIQRLSLTQIPVDRNLPSGWPDAFARKSCPIVQNVHQRFFVKKNTSILPRGKVAETFGLIL
jgi:hypothetical protein